MLSSLLGLALVAFLSSGFVFWRKVREEHYLEAEAFDGFLMSWVVGLFWARLGFVVLHVGQFQLQVWHWIDVVSRPGLSALTGFVGGSWFLYRFAKGKKWDVMEIFDYWSAAVAQALIWIWLGLLLDGTRFGDTTSWPIGIMFPGVFEPHHPVQLYAALAYAGLFWYLWWLELHYRRFEWYKAKRKSAQSGFLTAVFLMGHGVIAGVLSLVSPGALVVLGTEWDPAVAGLSLVLGFWILVVRSGRWHDWTKRRAG